MLALAMAMALGMPAERGNGFPSEHGALLFHEGPCMVFVESPETQYKAAAAKAAQRFEIANATRPTTFKVFASCHTDDMTEPNQAVEKVIIVGETGTPIQPIRFRILTNVQQNAFGAKRIVRDGAAEFAAAVFGPDVTELVIAVVTDEDRFNVRVKPADMAILRAK